MIRTYTASPSTIEKIDMTKAGDGTGTAIHAAGMYFGSPLTVQHYLEQYRGYSGAERVFMHNGMEVQKGSPAHAVMDYLFTHEFDYDQAADHFKGNKKALHGLDMLHKGGTRYDFTVYSGVCHEVELRNVNIDDLPNWEDRAPEEFVQEVALQLYEFKLKDKLPNFDHESAGISKPDSVDQLIDRCFNAAVEHADEHFGFSTNFDKLRESWDALIRLDSVYQDTQGEYFEALLNTPQWRALKSFIGERLEINIESPYSTLYNRVAYELSGGERPGNKATDQGKQLASQFFANKLRVPGFTCESTHGRPGEVMYVVFDEYILKSSKFEPISHEDFSQKIELGDWVNPHRRADSMDEDHAPSYGRRRG